MYNLAIAIIVSAETNPFKEENSEESGLSRTVFNLSNKVLSKTVVPSHSDIKLREFSSSLVFHTT